MSYLNARYYNGATGQFLSQDPVFLGNPKDQNLENPQSLNSYSYAQGNPIANSDPSGKCIGPLLGVCAYAVATAPVWVPPVITWTAAAATAIATPLVGTAAYSYAQGDRSSGDILIGGAMSVYGGTALTAYGILSANASLGDASSVPKSQGVQRQSKSTLNFRPGSLGKHYDKHSAEWSGDFGMSQYLQKAQNLLGDNPENGVQSFQRQNGDLLRYNSKTNEFGVKTQNGIIRIFFRPLDGQNYWDNITK